MNYLITQYLKFLRKSTNQHGVHSPFVYELVTKCFYDKTKHPDYDKLKSYRNALLKDRNSITVNDLGVGSRITKQQERRISDIAKHAGSTGKRAKLLHRITSYFQPKNILELGTSLGIATQAMSLAAPKAHITTLEGCPNISKVAKNNFKTHQLNNITLITGNFNDILTTTNYQLPTTNYLIFLDGNHQKEATIHYFKTLLPTIHNDTVLILDDIHWSQGMTEAWETIKQHPQVTVTIDTFFWGFVFFRKEQAKEHFIIRV